MFDNKKTCYGKFHIKSAFWWIISRLEKIRTQTVALLEVRTKNRVQYWKDFPQYSFSNKTCKMVQKITSLSALYKSDEKPC